MSDTPRYYAAADLGASSGRVMLGRLADGGFQLTELHRFENGAVRAADGSLRWDVDRLYAEVLEGFRRALATEPELASVGIDTWGVDYARLDAEGALLETPFSYRDKRTDGVPARFFAGFPAERLYGVTGLQLQPFNTVFQLVSVPGDPRWDDVATLLFTPDLFAWRLTGVAVAEVTMASTSGLLDVAARRWSDAVLDHLAARHGVPARRVLPPLVEPGTIVGRAMPAELGAPVPVVAVGSHDTASAVAAVPAETERFAYISSGTWSLVGVELDAPVLTPASRAANFTNELGVDGRVRYLKNVMGLWVLQECARAWRQEGSGASWQDLVELAARRTPLACVVDIDDPRLLPPGNMVERLQRLARETGQVLAADPGSVTRCILDSLALAYAQAVRAASDLSGREVDVIHIVGGGSQNELLCQLTAEATGLPVVAGPAEGTALGNLLVQAQATGAIGPGLAALRRVAVASADVTAYHPGVLPIPAARWAEAQQRL